MTSSVPIKFLDYSLFHGCVYREERAYRDDLKAGDAAWAVDNRALQFMCPCGCGAVHAVMVYTPDKQEEDGANGWMWNADKTKPTLLPSLGLNPKDGKATDGSGFHWHGHLVDGVFVPC